MSNSFASADGGGFNRETWLTPPALLQALGPFDLDPCAAPSPRPWPTAARHIELPEDGLRAAWSGMVWCNPPYGAQAAHWLARCADHGSAIALVFARTETAMFQDVVWRRAAALLFLRGRIAFCDRSGKPALSAGAPSVLIAFDDASAERLERSGIAGHLMRQTPTAATAQESLFGEAA